MSLHPTAIIDPAAELHESVSVGPYAVIGPKVRVGKGTTVGAHCVIEGRTTIGENNRIFQFSSIGAMPQDMKYDGEDTELVIGDRNTIREFCTFNTGTVQDGGVTRVGSDNWIMAYVHLAHDVQLGSHCTLANNATLGGHVHLGDWAFVGGLSGLHQFVHVGAHAMIGFQGHVAQDVPPFVTVAGNPLGPRSINLTGLKRRGFSSDRLDTIKQMYRLLYRSSMSLEEAQKGIADLAGSAPVEASADIESMLEFLAQAKRGIVR